MGTLLPNNNPLEARRVVPLLDKIIQFSLFTFAAFSMFSISVTQIAFALGALAWLLKTYLTKSWKELRGTWVGLAILCYCLAIILAVSTAVDLESSFKHLKKLLQLIIFFWVANSVTNAKQRDLLIKLLIVAGSVSAIYGLYLFWDKAPGETYRIEGTMSVVSTFSGILMLVGLVVFGRIFFQKPKEYWVMGSAGIICLCLLTTMTRQAWLGYFVGIVFLVFIWNKKYLFSMPLLIVSLLLFAPDTVTDRIYSFKNLKDYSLQVRISLWKGG